MSKLSSLKARLGPPARGLAGPRVSSGFPARYRLRADESFVKSISAIFVLVRRHMPLLDAKRAIERLMVGQEIVVDLPMLEDAALFESELRELRVTAIRQGTAAAAEG